MVSQGNTFYWVVQVTIDSDSTVQSITLTDLLRVSDINKVLGNGDVKWSYTGSGSAVTDSGKMLEKAVQWSFWLCCLFLGL